MIEFAALVDALVYTRSRNEKLRLIARYLQATPDPDRGWALAALTEGLSFSAVKGGTIRTLMAERVDPVLWAREPRLRRRHCRDGKPALAATRN